MTNRPAATYLLTAEGRQTFVELVRALVEEHPIRSVGDFGGGANPILDLDDIDRLGLRYLVIDASVDELAKAPAGYRTQRADFGAGSLDLDGGHFDLVVSRFVAEHVEDPMAFHAAIWNALRPGGFAAHFFPTLPAPPFLLNRLLTATGSRRLVDALQPGWREPSGRVGKFRAYYHWCEGPTNRQYRRFASVGFDVLEYVVLVGHQYYARWPPIQRAANAVSRCAIRLRRPVLSTYACVVLRRTGA